PTDLHRDELAQKPLGSLVIRQEVVVHKKDVPAFLALDLAKDFGSWPDILGLVEVRADRAEIAGKAAAAAELHQRDGQVSLAAKEIAARQETAGLSHANLGVVNGLQAPVASVVDNFGPAKFSVADID